MDKVTLKLSRNELVNLSDCVAYMCDENSYAHANTSKANNALLHFTLGLRCATLELLSLRLQRLRIEVKPMYRVAIPANECFGLLSSWMDRYCGPSHLTMIVQPLIGRIDQALS